MDYTILIASLETGRRLEVNNEGIFSAVPEAKRKGSKRRANGESAKQLAALNQAVNDLSATLNDKTVLNTNELISLHKGLSKRINYIKSHTTGVFGWLCSLFRSKKETKALKAVGSKLREVHNLVIRTQGAAGTLVANNIMKGNQSNAQILKMIRAEFPQLIHQGPVTAHSFGMSAQDPTPKIPFLITVNANSSYQIHFPPYQFNGSVITHTRYNLYILPTLYKNYIKDYGHEIRQKIDAYLYTDLGQRPRYYDFRPLEDAHLIETELLNENESTNPYVKIGLKYTNPETNQRETVYVLVNRHMTYEEVKNKVDEVIKQNRERAGRVEEFLQATFKNDSDENGISLDRSGAFIFRPTPLKEGSWYRTHDNFSILPIRVEGLGRDSYQKIKAIKEGFERNVAILKLKLLPIKDIYCIDIKGSFIQVEFDSINRQIILKGYFNQAIYARVPYTGDLQKALNDLEDVLPIREKCTFSSQVLSKVNAMSGGDHVTKLPNVSLNKLKQFKKKINFSGHDLTTANDGGSITKQRILSGIDRIVDLTAKYRAGHSFQYYGIPTGNDERKKYFDELEARLTHIIAALEKPENREMLSEVMINLGVGGNHCGGRWKDEVAKYYSMLCRPQVDEKNIPLDTWLQINIDQKKQETVEKMVTEANSQNTGHVRMRYLKYLKEVGIAVPGWEAAMYDDPYRRMGGGVFENKIFDQFNSRFDFSNFLPEWKDEISKRLKNYEGDGALICQNFGGEITNRLRAIIRTRILPDMPEKQAEFARLDHIERKPDDSDEDYQKRIVNKKNEFLDQIIDDLKLITVDEITYAMDGVTTRGMLLLALQTGVLEFKTDQKPLEFIQTLTEN